MIFILFAREIDHQTFVLLFLLVRMLTLIAVDASFSDRGCVSGVQNLHLLVDVIEIIV